MIAGDLAASATHALPVHPAQLYEAAGALFVLLLTLLARGRQRRPGQLALIPVGGYWLLRVGVDTWRTVSVEVWAARVFAVAVLATALYFTRTRPAPHPASRES